MKKQRRGRKQKKNSNRSHLYSVYPNYVTNYRYYPSVEKFSVASVISTILGLFSKKKKR